MILLGIEEHLKEVDFTKRFFTKGLANPTRIITDFWNTVNSEKVSASILVDGDVEEILYHGKNIIVITVPQADYRQRPVYINSNPIRGTYKRNFDGDYHCTEEEVKTMIRDASDSGLDGCLLTGYTLDDIDPETLRNYRNEYQVRNPDHVWNSLDNREFLRNLGGLAVDRSTGREWLTAAGLLMFGRGIPIHKR